MGGKSDSFTGGQNQPPAIVFEGVGTDEKKMSDDLSEEISSESLSKESMHQSSISSYRNNQSSSRGKEDGGKYTQRYSLPQANEEKLSIE